MIITESRPIKSKVLIIEEGLAQLKTALGRSPQSLVDELELRDVVIIKAINYQDGLANIVSDASIHAVLLSWELEGNTDSGQPPAALLLEELANRHENIPVFLMAQNSERVRDITEHVMSQVEEIAKTKMPDLNADSLAAAVNTVLGTARSMGIEVEG